MMYAAASTKDATEAILQSSPVPTQLNIAGSSVLARQIEAGAPVGVFLSADTAWMDHLEQQNLLQPRTRAPLLGGQLVLITHKDAPPDPRSWQDRLREAPHIALADPEHVPAGRYAKVALTHAGLYSDIEAKVVGTANVRGALALVIRQEVELAVVYATDAKLSQKVRIIETLALPKGVEVRYSMAGIADHFTPQTQALLEHFRSPQARDIFQSFGFTVAAP
jgi:molybdate transport system substrate-binding protein